MMDRDEKYDSLVARYDGPVSRDEPMSAHTTFGTGGNADIFIDITDEASLSQAIRLARQLSLPHFIIGQGSNLLVGDGGYRGVIIRNSIRHCEVQGNDVIAGAGELLDKVVDFATERSLTGLEFAAGIWGTIGGAVYGNAGAFGSQMSSVLVDATLIDADGNARVEASEYFAFSYRNSILETTGEIVCRTRLRLSPDDSGRIARRTEEIRQTRGGRHPVAPCSAGCFFKNVEDASQPFGKLAAGKLLDEIGAKEIIVGKAGVFGKHANIIVNKGGASSQDIRRLADILKQKVKEKYNVELQEEVICLGEF